MRGACRYTGRFGGARNCNAHAIEFIRDIRVHLHERRLVGAALCGLAKASFGKAKLPAHRCVRVRGSIPRAIEAAT
jgi:hypothetical protein